MDKPEIRWFDPGEYVVRFSNSVEDTWWRMIVYEDTGKLCRIISNQESTQRQVLIWLLHEEIEDFRIPIIIQESIFCRKLWEN